MAEQKLYPIRVVSRLTGLSAHVIRKWEDRYQAVVPSRTETNRRLYTDLDVMKLKLLQKLTSFGYAIGQIGSFPVPKLQELVQVNMTQEESDSQILPDSNQDLLQAAMEAVIKINAPRLEQLLMQALVKLGQSKVLDQLIIPLLEELGTQWKNGNIRIYHEHLATTVIRKYLTDQLSKVKASSNAPSIIVTTPLGQLHELGALIVALTAANLGWQIIYLGANLPAEDIAAAAAEKNIKYILLSIVYPANDPLLYTDILHLNQLLDKDVKLLIGGRAAKSYQQAINETNSFYFEYLNQLRDFLQTRI